MISFKGRHFQEERDRGTGSANAAAMFRLLIFLVTLSVRALRAIFRTREELMLENLALRQ